MEYRPDRDRYWDEAALLEDLRQAFDICNGCRLCHNLCPSFPLLFEQVEGHDNNAQLITAEETAAVADLCFQCKLCFVKCPYTPPHRFDLDFPRLMLRSKAVRVKRRGLSLADRFLGDPDRTGRLGSRAPALANWANRSPILRRMLEAQVGIDRRRHLPRFAPMRFSQWARRAAERRAVQWAAVADADLAIFPTCTVEYYHSSIGQATVAVLQHHGMRTALPDGLTCCGMPAMDGGDIEGAVARARANVARLAPYAKAGKPIVALQPTCAMVLKQEYPVLLPGEDAQAVAAHTQDITEYLAAAMQAGKLSKAFVWSPGTVTYHLSCHSKAQGLNRAAAQLLRAIPDTTVNVVDRCAGIDGTWGLKAAYYDQAQKVASRLTRAFQEAHGTQACSDCALAGLQIEVASEGPPLHPVQILARAYGLGAGKAPPT